MPGEDQQTYDLIPEDKLRWSVPKSPKTATNDALPFSMRLRK
jgi:hypothetical protein